MQHKTLHRYRFVHIIFFWVIGLFGGMMLFYHFQYDFLRIIRQDGLAPVSFFALLLSSVLPLLLTIIFLHQGIYPGCYVTTFVKAFLYGFSLMSYAGAKSCLLLFSQTNSSILLLLLILLRIFRPELAVKKLYLAFLFTDLFFILFDCFVICPLYS